MDKAGLLSIIKKYERKGVVINFSLNVFKGKEFKFDYNESKLMYAASLPKIFIAAEVFRQCELNVLNINNKILVKNINIVRDPQSLKKINNNELDCFEKEVSILELVEKMLIKSSNTAANELIDITNRENINKYILKPNGWEEANIYRKFLPRAKEEIRYKDSQSMVVSSSIIAEFFYKLANDILVSKYVSSELKKIFCNKYDKDYEYTLRLDSFNCYYNKYGSFRTSLFSYGLVSAIKGILKLQRIKPRIWLHDSGLVCIGIYKYSISLMTYTKSFSLKKFPIKRFSEEVLKEVLK